MKRKFVRRKDLGLYRQIYARVCERRILFYNSIGDEEPYESIQRAYNLLSTLRVFMDSVPRRVVRERFDDFRDAKDLALEITKN